MGKSELSGLGMENQEVNLIALAKTIWNQRKIVTYLTGGFASLGLILALISPVEFTSGSVFVPQVGDQQKIGGNIGGLASLAGINLNSIGGSSDIQPTLYPKIASSVSFRKSVLESKITFGNKRISYAEYFLNHYENSMLESLKKYTLGLPTIILKLVKPAEEGLAPVSEEEKLVTFSLIERDLFLRLEGQYSVQTNEKEGFVAVSFTMPEPLMAAEMAKNVEDLLQKEVIGFKIKNAKEQLKFVERQFEEKKVEFEVSQNKLAAFRDKNQNISSSQMQNQLQRLEAEYNFSFGIYNELAKQVEQAKLQVSRDTPVFSIIQPVTVPVEKSAPRRVLIVIGLSFLGFAFSLAVVFVRDYLKEKRSEWGNF